MEMERSILVTLQVEAFLKLIWIRPIQLVMEWKDIIH